MYAVPIAPVESKTLKLPEVDKSKERVYANRHSPDRCPRCNSHYHYILPDGRSQCGECEKVWGKKIQQKPAAA